MGDETESENSSDRGVYSQNSSNNSLNSANLCQFTGYTFCNNCMSDKPSIIPRKILADWDWNQYNVAFLSYKFIQSAIKLGEQIDVSKNKKLPNLIPQILKTNDLKKNLAKIVKYADNCRLADTRECLFAGLDGFDSKYTIQELLDLKKFTNLYQVLFNKISEHVDSCLVCQGNGSFCEYCNDDEVIFSWSTSTTECKLCGMIAHSQCLLEASDDGIGCMKCERLQRR